MLDDKAINSVGKARGQLTGDTLHELIVVHFTGLWPKNVLCKVHKLLYGYMGGDCGSS